MKPTSLFMAVAAGIVLAIWWTFFRDNGLKNTVENQPVTTED